MGLACLLKQSVLLPCFRAESCSMLKASFGCLRHLVLWHGDAGLAHSSGTDLLLRRTAQRPLLRIGSAAGDSLLCMLIAVQDDVRCPSYDTNS